MSVKRGEFTVTWCIENFFFCTVSNRNCLSSPKFTAENLDGSEWDLNLYPRGDTVESKGCVSLHLVKYCSDFSVDEKEIDLNVKFCNADNEVILELNKNSSTELGYTWVFSKVLEFEELEEKMNKFPKNTLVIRCRMSMDQNPDEECTKRTNCSFQTMIGFDKYCFSWNVNSEHSKDVLMKKLLTDVTLSQFEIILKANENGDILIEISRIGRHYRNHKVKCQIYLLNNEGTDILSSVDFYYFDCESKEGDVWRFPPFFKKSVLSAGSCDYCSTIQFTFSISNDMRVNKFTKEETKSGSSSKTFASSTVACLQSDLLDLLSYEKHTDVELLVENEIIRAHKLILASRSPVLSTMFELDMIESQTGTIDIPDMSSETARLFLKFLYTGMLDELDWRMALELLLAAEKYQVSSLKEKCSHVLTTFRLDEESVCDVVAVADMVGDQASKTSAITYIQKNVVRVLSSPNWPKWIRKNGELGSEILCKLSEKTLKEHSNV